MDPFFSSTAVPGMLCLVASVVCNVTVSVLLKLARGTDADARQIIFANYICAGLLCGLIFAPAPEALRQALAGSAWPVTLALAVLLPAVFMAMVFSVRHAGIVRSDTAQRLSLFITLLAAFALFGQALTWIKGLALLLAFAALACLLNRPGRSAARRSAGAQAWFWPLTVWVGYGVIDVLFKKLAQTGAAFTSALLVIFALAALLMLLYLLARRTTWHPNALLAGLLLGLVNFGNIYTYIKAHQLLASSPAQVFASMNLGVIALGALIGALVFREKLSGMNLLGLLLAFAAIIAMTV